MCSLGETDESDDESAKKNTKSQTNPMTNPMKKNTKEADEPGYRYEDAWLKTSVGTDWFDCLKPTNCLSQSINNSV